MDLHLSRTDDLRLKHYVSAKGDKFFIVQENQEGWIQLRNTFGVQILVEIEVDDKRLPVPHMLAPNSSDKIGIPKSTDNASSAYAEHTLSFVTHAYSKQEEKEMTEEELRMPKAGSVKATAYEVFDITDGAKAFKIDSFDSTSKIEMHRKERQGAVRIDAGKTPQNRNALQSFGRKGRILSTGVIFYTTDFGATVRGLVPKDECIDQAPLSEEEMTEQRNRRKKRREA